MNYTPAKDVPLGYRNRSRSNLLRSTVGRLLAICFVALSLTLTSCGSGNSESNSGAIRLALNWYPDAQHGGFYTALIEGYYEEEGLQVEIIPGGPNTKVLENVQVGRAEFGVSNADQILLKRNQQGTLVALMAPLQDSPRCILVHKKSGIQSLEELREVTLALGPGRPFVEYMKRHADLESVRIVNYSGSITRFVADENYAQQGYVFTEPLLAERQGAEVNVLMLSDIGYNPYTSCVFVEQSYLDANPETAAKFIRASVRGWQEYLRNPEPANELILEKSPELDAESLRYAAGVIRPLCLPDGMSESELGRMTDGRWDKLLAQLKEIEFVEQQLSVEGAYLDLVEVADLSDADETEGAESESD